MLKNGETMRNDADDDSSSEDDCPVHPLIEMSQDCVVEWNDESQELVPSSGTKTPLRSSSASPKNSSGRRRKRRSSIELEEVRRKLEDQNNQRSANENRGAKSKVTGEAEVDAIFNILQQEDAEFRGQLSPAEMSTQHTANHPKKVSGTLYRKRPNSSSLAARRRRRQCDRIPLSNKRQQLEALSEGSLSAATVAAACTTPPPSTKEGAFDSLLKHLATREISERRPPVSDRVKENTSLSSSVSGSTESLRTGGANPKQRTTVDTPEPLSEANIPSDSAENVPRAPTPAGRKPEPKSSVTASRQNAATKAKNISEAHSNLNFKPAEPSVQAKSTRNSSTNNSNIIPENADPKKDSGVEEEDEFGDFDLGDLDMGCLDTLLAAKSSQHAAAVSKPTVLKFEGTKSIAATSKTAGATSQAPTPTARGLQETPLSVVDIEKSKQEAIPGVKILSQDPIVEDEFGDFPDVDFDMIDQAIASRRHVDSPFTRELVSNPRSMFNDYSDLSYIKFSRYKILKVEVNEMQYTKTLSLAAWTENMLNDDKEETKIHRNCNVQEDPGDGRRHQMIRRKLTSKYTEAGQVQLRGSWFYSELEEGDVIHICSLTGRFRTDQLALPIVLHTNPPYGSVTDDLVLIHHPDMLMTPTVVSDSVSCSRRAVLKSRIGSNGLTSKSALIGTLRHALFGLCIKDRNFEKSFVVRKTKRIVRENAEAMVGCGVSTDEAEKQLLDTLPVLLEFVKHHTTFLDQSKVASLPTAYVDGHVGDSNNVRFAVHSTYSIEEPVISHELALKGYVDAVLETTTTAAGKENDPVQHTINGLKHSLMALELKTGHNQTSQHMHMGQLSLYTLMLQGRFGTKLGSGKMLGSGTPRKVAKPDPEGAAPGGLLLYLNDKSSKATHVAPAFDEFKSLIGNRNIVAAHLVKASKPRGVALRYEDDEESSNADENDKSLSLSRFAPPVLLPEVQRTDQRCKRCFENRSCMLYAASETEREDRDEVRKSHGELMRKFVGRLNEDDLEYFRKWDRLIDLEAHATVGSVATAWLIDSHTREKATGETVSSLKYDGAFPGREPSQVLIFFRKTDAHKMGGLSIVKGSHVVVSTDGSTFDDSQSDPKTEYENTQRERKKFRHHMNVVRGFLDEINNDGIVVAATHDDLNRIRSMNSRYKSLVHDGDNVDLLFRVDKDNAAVGIGTLRQNLINFLTADHARSSNEEPSQLDIARQRRLSRLRGFVVRLTPPTFRSITDESLFTPAGPALPGCDMEQLSLEFKTLNHDQQAAVRKVVGSNDYILIQGLPGTGKTSTLAYITRLLAARGKRVLITSYTNAAVDNVVIKLSESGVTGGGHDSPSAVLRVGPRKSCHELVKSFHLTDVAIDFEKQNTSQDDGILSQSSSQRTELPRAETLRQIMSSARIICSTVLTVPRSPLLANEIFDVVIVDEAGQTSQPSALGALMAADSFVLVGDHKQLPPLVNSEIAEAGGFAESFLSRLATAHPTAVAALTYQYRMNEEICRLSSDLVYDGQLKCADNGVRGQKLMLPGFPNQLPRPVPMKGIWPWLRMTISPGTPVLFVDTDNIRKIGATGKKEKGRIEALEQKLGGRAGGKVTNPTEQALVRCIIKGLVSSGASLKDIGIISPFRAQTQLLQNDNTLSEAKKSGLEISTIDQYQGRDKPVIVVSFVRSNPDGHTGRLLQDMRRLNVALTRAKFKLIMVGSFSTLEKGSTPLRPLLGRVNANRQRQLLPENALDCYQIN